MEFTKKPNFDDLEEWPEEGKNEEDSSHPKGESAPSVDSGEPA